MFFWKSVRKTNFDPKLWDHVEDALNEILLKIMSILLIYFPFLFKRQAVRETLDQNGVAYIPSNLQFHMQKL